MSWTHLVLAWGGFAVVGSLQVDVCDGSSWLCFIYPDCVHLLVVAHCWLIIIIGWVVLVRKWVGALVGLMCLSGWCLCDGLTLPFFGWLHWWESLQVDSWDGLTVTLFYIPCTCPSGEGMLLNNHCHWLDGVGWDVGWWSFAR